LEQLHQVKKSDGIARGVYGSWTGDGTAMTMTLGFVPSYLQLINKTDVIIWEKINGMAGHGLRSRSGHRRHHDARHRVG
jgi:hypothetical protein